MAPTTSQPYRQTPIGTCSVAERFVTLIPVVQPFRKFRDSGFREPPLPTPTG